MAHFGFPLETIIVFFAVIFFSIYMDLIAHINLPRLVLQVNCNIASYIGAF